MIEQGLILDRIFRQEHLLFLCPDFCHAEGMYDRRTAAEWRG